MGLVAPDLTKDAILEALRARRTLPFSNPVLYTWTPRVGGSPGHYYYVKAYHDVDSWALPAYTSPIWTDTSEITSWSIYLVAIMRDYSSGR
jgi:hypothetical protein